jgi:hypothetical protein
LIAGLGLGMEVMQLLMERLVNGSGMCVVLQVTAARAVLAKADAEKAELEAEAKRVRNFVTHIVRAIGSN